MILAFIVPFIIIIILIVFLKCKNFSTKFISIFLLLIALVITVALCINKPQMHNRISLNIIDYLIKFNADGSMTTTKQVTTEVIKGNGKQ